MKYSIQVTQKVDGLVKKYILLFRDLLQLPPVEENPAYEMLTKNEMNRCLGSFDN